MALLNPTFIFGILVVAYLSSFVVFALLRIVTGLSIQRIGYFSLRRLAYTPKDGIKLEIRGLGLNVHRPTFSQPTWLSIVVSELVVTVDIKELEGHKNGTADVNDEDGDLEVDKPKPFHKKSNLTRRATFGVSRSETWKQLTRIKERIKKLHRNIHWLRMVDVVATNSTVNIVDVGNIQCGSFTVAVDTRRKMVDRARFFFQTRADKKRQKQQAEWIFTLRSVLFTAQGGEASEVLDNAILNVHGFLYEKLDGLRDATIALKLGRVHIPYDDVQTSIELYKRCKRIYGKDYHTVEALDVSVDQVIQELDNPGSTDQDIMQAVSDSKEFVSSILRGIKEVQFNVSLAGLSKRIDSIKASGAPLLLNFSMKEVGIDLHRLDPKSPAHRMYFPSKDLAHEALAAALSISVGLDDGHGKPERLVYIPMATTTVKTTLPSKTVELSDDGSAEERNANILFANSVVTSPSVDLDPKHLPIILALLRPKPKAPKAKAQPRHLLISRLLPKANIKFTMHEPVIRIALPSVHKTNDPDDFDLIISSISSISLDVESFHSAVEDLHYSLVSQTRIQTHHLYYQTTQGNRFDLVDTEFFDLKLTVGASPDVQVMANGHLQSLAVKMVRPEIADGVRQIIRQLRLDVEPDKISRPKFQHHRSGLRAFPPWLLHFQVSVDDFSVEIAGVDDDFPNHTRGIALQVDSWSAEYRAQRMDAHLRQRPVSRRRAASRAIMPDPELLKSAPTTTSPRKKQPDYVNEGDGRRIAIHIRGLEAFIVDDVEKWEVDPFIHMPRFEVALSTHSDKQGPILHVHSHLKTLLCQYSLYRHYAVGVAIMVLKKAFMRTRRDTMSTRTTQHHSPASPTPVDHLAPPILTPESPATDQMDNNSRFAKELVSIDAKAGLIQIKADLPADPPVMLQMFGIEAGRHRWSAPFFHTRLIRVFAGAPRMQGVWARVASIQAFRLDYRESRKFTAFGYQEDRLFDINTDAMRLAVPHELVIHKISDNFINVFKASQQLHHRFKTGTNEYILEKGPEGPKVVPKVSIRTRHLLFELEDGAFEWKLGMIYRAGRVEQIQRLAREEAYRVKVKKIHEQEIRRESNRLRNRSAMARGRTNNAGVSWNRSRSEDERPRTAMDGRPPDNSPRGRKPRYDPDEILDFSGTSHVSIQEARQKLNEHNAMSWKKRIDRYYAMARRGMQDLRGLFWAPEDMPDDLDGHEKILEVPERPALMSTVIDDLHLMIDKPSFPMSKLPDFLYEMGKGMPKDMKYSLLVPMNVQISMGQAKMSLRDYPLPLLHVPALKSGQSSRLPALSLKTDFVIAEEYRGNESTRKIKVQITPPTTSEPGQPSGSFAIDVRRTVGPVKSYSDMHIDINTAYPTRITWAPSYQPAIQDMMMVIESFTKPQLDPSEKVGFWDKIRLNFHSRVRVAWKGEGSVHLALKGTRDPYSVTGNGAGFLMCWRNDVRWGINVDNEPKKFMTVDSGEYVLAIPDYSHQERELARRIGESDSVSTDDGYKSGAMFKKVVMKLSGNVQWMAGLVFERAIEDGNRNFDFRPHYDIVLKAPHHAKPDGNLPYDAFRGFRSQHIHLSIAVRAPVDRDWRSTELQSSKSYNTVHLTPRFFTHFFAWWSTFGGPMSLPIRQGTLWPGREKNSKKFGRHLGTIKYNLLLAPLFMSHIYKHKDTEDYSENSVSATGIKVRFDSFMLDMHQRREEFNTRDRGRNTQSRTTAMKIHAAQLDLVSADVRAVSASIKGTTTEAIKKNSVSTLISQGSDGGTDLSHFTIPDNDYSWIDMDDFVELDWILPSEPNPDTKILPLAYAPRVTYFRQTDIGGIIAGDPNRTSPFGHEPTHLCIMSQDDNPREVQRQLIEQRLEQLDNQIEINVRDVGEKELHVIRDGGNDPQLKAEFETFSRHTGVLKSKQAFMRDMLSQVSLNMDESENASSSQTTNTSQDTMDFTPDDAKDPDTTGAEFASEFKNRFVVHNMQLKWNNLLRNIILRYSHQVSQRRGFVYYLSRPAVKFILDIVEEQAKAKSKDKLSGSPEADSFAPTPHSNNSNINDAAQDIEHRIKQILQDGRKFVNADDSDPAGDSVPTVSMEDLTSGIAEDFTPQNSYHVRLIAPQIQLQSDKNKKHAVLITSKGMELKVVQVMEKARIFDDVSGLVQHRFLVRMDGTQFFVSHQKWFSGPYLPLYSGNTYGAVNGTTWPPWVPMEVMFDFQTDPFGFKRVVQKTSAMLRYDKYNTLRLKYNDDINDSERNNDDEAGENTESRMDNLWVEFPQARALCNSSQYYAIYVIVLDLLLYSEPMEKTRSERLEKIMLASDFSDLRGTPEMVIKLQERIRQLEEIKSHFQIHQKYLDKKGWQDRLVLERDLTACEDELFFMMKAITTSQRKYETTSQSNALLRWSISAKEIVWHLVRDVSEPLVELQLRDVEYDRTDNSDGSHINLFQVGKVIGLNLLPDATYPEMIVPYNIDEKGNVKEYAGQQMVRVYWHMLEAIAGIPIMDHFEVNLFPMKIQLEREVGQKLFEYIFPQVEGDNPTDNSNGGSSRTDSPFMVKPTVPDADDDQPDESMSSSGRVGSIASDKDSTFNTRAGSLELRLRPTLTSDSQGAESTAEKSKALSVHSTESHMFRLFGGKAASKKPSYESLRTNLNTPRPGVGRSSTIVSTTSDSTNKDKKATRFALRGGAKGSDDKGPGQSDDLSKMITRASNYMTFVYIKLPSVVLCLSYKGKGERNIEDVHDFVFRLPTIEYRNKTWSNLDLALALKSRVIKALISHTGAIIGNKFSKHRPNTAQTSKLRELANSSVLLAAPILGGGGSSNKDGDLTDDSSSLFGTSPVDYSRSPPRSLTGSQSSIPVPQRSDSRSSSIASSRKSYRSANIGNGNAVPKFLMMTPDGSQQQQQQQRPATAGAGLEFESQHDVTPKPRPGTRGSLRPVSRGSANLLEIPDDTKAELHRRRTGGGGGGSGAGGSNGGFLRGKFNALTSKLGKDRESSSLSRHSDREVRLEDDSGDDAVNDGKKRRRG
ncbi:mitochondrial protein from FMP27-domain-containing protein [Xylariales sp. PMI_506]|nr:mitochondrial protein from FMP27-domain-containing protein [Xylariales sp. PMI_506]